MCASFTDQLNASMEGQEKPKITEGTHVNMNTLQFVRNSKSLKKQKRDVRKKNVSKCIIIFANGTIIARIKKIANLITQKRKQTKPMKSNNQPSFQSRDGSRPERRYECNNYDSSEKKKHFLGQRYPPQVTSRVWENQDQQYKQTFPGPENIREQRMREQILNEFCVLQKPTLS